MKNPYSIVVESTEPYIISYVPEEKDANVNGVVHGGVLFYLCDDIVGRYVTYKGRKGAAADGNIHYYRPAAVGEKIIVSISERKTGKRLGTYLVELRNEEGKLLADSLLTGVFFE